MRAIVAWLRGEEATELAVPDNGVGGRGEENGLAVLDCGVGGRSEENELAVPDSGVGGRAEGLPCLLKSSVLPRNMAERLSKWDVLDMIMG